MISCARFLLTVLATYYVAAKRADTSNSSTTKHHPNTYALCVLFKPTTSFRTKGFEDPKLLGLCWGSIKAADEQYQPIISITIDIRGTRP